MYLIVKASLRLISRSWIHGIKAVSPRPGLARAISSLSPAYDTEIDCESLQRYRPGGYHPVNINDTFGSGRYQVLHKLGWGGYSTVWLVRDHALHKLAALKVVVAELNGSVNEVRILEHMSSLLSDHQGRHHVCPLRDRFVHQGPNGRHHCLVFDIEGTSVQTIVNHEAKGIRLPGRVAWEISRQAVLAIDFLHTNGITHGDLYTSNILVSSHETDFTDLSLLQNLPPVVEEEIYTAPGYRLTNSFPRRVIEPVVLPAPANLRDNIHAKLIDFGQSWITTDKRPSAVHTPLVFRAPETVLDSRWGQQIDIWSLACVIFDLVVGQPPFDNLMPSQPSIVLEWIASFGAVPIEWQARANEIIGSREDQIEGGTLMNWLHESYFNNEYAKPEFSKADVDCLGDLLLKMMRYRPEDRCSSSAVLDHAWFARNPLDAKLS